MGFLDWLISAIWGLSDEGSDARRYISILILCFAVAALAVVLLKVL